jgi:hypothetical protein
MTMFLPWVGTIINYRNDYKRYQSKPRRRRQTPRGPSGEPPRGAPGGSAWGLSPGMPLVDPLRILPGIPPSTKDPLAINCFYGRLWWGLVGSGRALVTRYGVRASESPLLGHHTRVRR